MNHLSKIKAKYIKTLQLKKHRLQEMKFIVEGGKSVLEFVHSKYKIHEIIGTIDFFNENQNLPNYIDKAEAKESDLKELGSFKTNNSAIAIVALPEPESAFLETEKIVLALDSINDPGNLGTIIRIADWFGIATILLGNGSVDPFNPKVVSATKGSLTRVKIVNCDLAKLLKAYKGEVLAADMHGDDLEQVEKLSAGVILMGNETHGIRAELDAFITKRITIAKHGGAESLNVAVATGIICNSLVK